jgi:hypothetical protein
MRDFNFMEIRFDEILNRLDKGVLIVDKNYYIIYANKKAKEIFNLDLSSPITCYSLFYQYSDPCVSCIKKHLTPEKPEVKLTLFLDKKLYLIEYSYFSEDKIMILVKDMNEEFYYKNSYFRLLENLPFLIIFIKKGKIKYLNSFSEKNLGYTKQELFDKAFTELIISPEERFNIEKTFNEVLAEEKEEEILINLLNREGKSKTYLGKCFAIDDIDKEKILIVSVWILQNFWISGKDR